MIRNIFVGAAVLTMALTVTARGGIAEEPKLIEVAARVGLTPRMGYDDNDDVQLVLFGNLPNWCYAVGPSVVEKDGQGGILNIRQYAFKKSDKLCINEQTLPEHMSLPVPYTVEVSVGPLTAGDYYLRYKLEQGRYDLRPLNVGIAPTLTVDSLPYAATSNAYVGTMISGAESVKVKINGMLTSSCTELTDEIRVEKVDDVFVVLPVVRLQTGVMCAQYLRPFEREIDLGKQVPGIYLLHVRSMNGKAINRVFEVTR